MSDCDVNWKDLVYYDETSPSCLRWKIDKTDKYNIRYNLKKDNIVGYLNKQGYWTLKHKYKTWTVHEIICIIHEISYESTRISHADGNKANNLLSNLKIDITGKTGKNLLVTHQGLMGFAGENYMVQYMLLLSGQH